mmetsp:Transcript_128864/g.275026  ORF Transcript_128864/g.275026 Transcript_128864/m.275026 type:complete len:207 (-) Transcript_128864:735-1355(-)
MRRKSSSTIAGAERRRAPRSSAGSNSREALMSMRAKILLTSRSDNPSRVLATSRNSLNCTLPSSAPPRALKASGRVLQTLNSRSRNSSSKRHGDTTAKAQARSLSETLALTSWASRKASKMARCSWAVMTHTRVSAAANSLKDNGCMVVSSPPPSMTAMACITELKPRQMRRFRNVSNDSTGAMASMPTSNSSGVRCPSWSASRSI